jgi:hypothetical protein
MASWMFTASRFWSSTARVDTLLSEGQLRLYPDYDCQRVARGLAPKELSVGDVVAIPVQMLASLKVFLRVSHIEDMSMAVG